MLARRRTPGIWKVLPFLGLTLLIHNFLILAGVVVYLVRPPEPLNQDNEPLDVSIVDDIVPEDTESADATEGPTRKARQAETAKSPTVEEKQEEAKRKQEEESVRAP